MEDPAFANAIQEVYEKAADPYHELRKSILEVCSKYATKLYTKEYGTAFQAVAASVPEFGGELSSNLARGQEGEIQNRRRYKCGGCSGIFIMKRVETNHTYGRPYCLSRYADSSWQQWEVKEE